MKYVPTTCPYCGCGCELILMVEDQELVGVMPGSSGKDNRQALCIKGWNAWQFVQDPARAQSPMIRSDKGDLAPVSWKEAIQVTADRIGDLQARHGKDSIVFLSSAKMTNEENYAFMRMVRGAFETNNIDHCARL